MDDRLSDTCQHDVKQVLGGSFYLPAFEDGQPIGSTVSTRLYRAQSSNRQNFKLYDDFDPNLRSPVQEFD